MKVWTVSLVCFAFGCFAFLPASSAQSEAGDGPVIEGYGRVYRISELDLPVAKDKEYRVVFDIADSPGNPSQLNISLNTLARFLNMHAQAGVPPSQLRVAAVLHGGATDDGLVHAAYMERHGLENPNLDLIHKLKAAGVEFFVCGQSMRGMGLDPAGLDEAVGVALSAMTALITLQDQGYRLIAW